MVQVLGPLHSLGRRPIKPSSPHPNRTFQRTLLIHSLWALQQDLNLPQTLPACSSRPCGPADASPPARVGQHCIVQVHCRLSLHRSTFIHQHVVLSSMDCVSSGLLISCHGSLVDEMRNGMLWPGTPKRTRRIYCQLSVAALLAHTIPPKQTLGLLFWAQRSAVTRHKTGTRSAYRVLSTLSTKLYIVGIGSVLPSDLILES